jgi:hypothetical protein
LITAREASSLYIIPDEGFLLPLLTVPKEVFSSCCSF